MTACAPAGSLAPWVDARPRTCTLCAAPVTLRALPDGSDWQAVDASGSPAGRRPFPPVRDCPATASLRALDPPRFYGHGIPAAAWFGGFHVHDGDGGQVFYTEVPEVMSPCGFRMPPERRVRHIEPLPGAAPPECCARPMRWAPRGWQCRRSGEYFTPAIPGVDAAV